MTAAALRKKVHQFIDDADSTKLKIIYNIINQLDKKGITSFEKLSIEEYNKVLKREKEKLRTENTLHISRLSSKFLNGNIYKVKSRLEFARIKTV